MRAYRADAGFDGRQVLRDGVVVVVDGDRIVDVETPPGDLPDGMPVTRPGRHDGAAGSGRCARAPVRRRRPGRAASATPYCRASRSEPAVIEPPETITLTTSTRRSTRARTAAANSAGRPSVPPPMLAPAWAEFDRNQDCLERSTVTYRNRFVRFRRCFRVAAPRPAQAWVGRVAGDHRGRPRVDLVKTNTAIISPN